MSVVCFKMGRDMSRRRKRKDDTSSGSLQESSSSGTTLPGAPSYNVSVGAADHSITVPLFLTGIFKEVFERAVGRARNQLASSGRIEPTVFFGYTNGMIKTGVLSFKDEFHKELLKKRVREKTLAENASVVIVLTEGERSGTILLSGAASGMRASARVDYAFDKNTKTITLWKVRWLDNPLRNAFLEGIFNTAS
ncbi:MAG: hypothetical protein A4E65_00243 [Syntrophorhabdus sp. PtaU1.Bin153]|nr:MAG: hypothetical protein A4E65_00243 [Syntrophorhabdus sp. PtaU1.Bin153]